MFHQTEGPGLASAAGTADGRVLTHSFADLGIAANLIEVLQAGGLTEPTEVQALAIPDALAGRDVCARAQTGSGKTLAFGLPLIERTTTANACQPHSLVLVPTRELANQVAEALAPFAAARGLWLTAIYGGVSMLRQIQALRAGVDIVIATPGRLNDLLERNEISLGAVRVAVVDEADQMADMGFLPQVVRILGKIDPAAQVMLFSATLDGDVGSLVRKFQHDPVRHEVVTEVVETLEHRFIGVTTETKVGVTASICGAAARALVFVRTTHGADRLARQLGQRGLRAAPLHGRLGQGRRESTLAAFASGEAPVLVATNVAARGLHVDGLDVVVHYDLPEDAKVFVHRSGRTARAGEAGIAVTLCLPEQAERVAQLQREAGISSAVETMREDDPRLLDLAAWQPAPAPASQPKTAVVRARNERAYSPRTVGVAPARPRRAQGDRRQW